MHSWTREENSWDVPNFCKGYWVIKVCLSLSGICSDIGVSMIPGHIEITQIPNQPRSQAIAKVTELTADFELPYVI